MIVILFLLVTGYVSISTETTMERGQKELTDADLFALLTKEFDLNIVSGAKVIIGTYKGTELIADFPCSDVCPLNTVKIIRFNVKANECSSTEGKEEELLTPMSISMGTKLFCVPEIIHGKQST